MRKDIDLNKLNNLPSANKMLDEKYGEPGTATRDAFEAKAKAWYYADPTFHPSQCISPDVKSLAF